MKSLVWIPIGIILIMSACSPKTDFENAYESINEKGLERHVRMLASDQFLGRAPFTHGEVITINYLRQELINLGFKPAFGDSYFQDVPLVEIQSNVSDAVIIKTPENSFELNWPDDIAISSPRIVKNISIDESEMVFAGFGITAPEYGWDDYKNIEVEGKTVVVLVNDPGLYTEDPDFFKGREMTYYGRWTYKYEEAAKRGAVGILIIHETLGAGYTYSIPRNSCMTPNLFMSTKQANEDMCLFNGWIQADAANRLFADLGHSVDELRTRACKAGFTGFDMDSKITVELNNSFIFNTSLNVGGFLEGKTRPEEVIIYSGHWDHFGIGEVQDGDSIFNGAVDNGTTMALVLEVGKAFAGLEERPDRSIMLFFPTAEEQGLLGSKFYTEFPPFEIENTVANINNDMVLPIGRMKDVMVTGYGQSELDDMLEVAAAKQDRYLYPDPNSHTGMYFRSDHFPFASKGVPALFARGNCDSRKYGKEWAEDQERDYLDNKYHKAADNYEPDIWNFDGIIEDAQLSFEIGYQLANSDKWPLWKDGSEFKHLRSEK